MPMVAELLQAYAADVLAALGAPAESAVRVADSLVRADRLGCHTHGAGLLPLYAKMIAAGRSTDGSQCGRRPRLALHHLGKQRQPHGDDFAVFRKTGDPADRPPPSLERRVKRGDLGRKTGRGFYDYSTDPPTPTED